MGAGKSILKVVYALIAEFGNYIFFAGLKSDYARLKSRRTEWQEYNLENELFAGTLADGLDEL